MSQRLTSTVLVGRDDELAVLAAALSRTMVGESRMVLIGGDPGVGKTRLLAEFRQAHPEAAFAVGHCLEIAPGDLPFAPWLAALSALPRGAWSGSMAPDLEFAGLVDASRSGLPSPDRLQNGSAARVLVGARRLLAAISAHTPLVLVLEDIQWAGRSTMELFEYLATTLRDERILLIATIRTHSALPRGEGFDIEAFLLQFDRIPGCEVLSILPLTPDQTCELIAILSGSAENASLTDQLAQRSHGNPLFVEELVAFVRAGGKGVPHSLRPLIIARVEGLSTTARLVLELMSVAGRPVSPTLLETAGALRPSESAAALRELMSRGLVDPKNHNEVALHHALVAETIVEGLRPSELRDRHGRLADGLQVSDAGLPNPVASAAELAHHLEAARRFEEAIGAATAAARAAVRARAYAEAHRLFGAIFRMREQTQLPSTQDTTSLLIEAADAAFAAGEGESAVTLIRAALAAPTDLEAEGALRRRLGTYLLSVLRDDEALNELERAVSLIPTQPPSFERARALGTWGGALMLAGRYRDSRRVCRAALGEARAMRDGYLIGQALSFLGVDLVNLGRATAGLVLLRRAVTVAREAGRSDGILEALLNHADMLNRVDRLTEAAAVALDGVQEAGEEGLARWIGTGLRAVAVAALVRLGELDRAEMVVSEGLSLLPTGEWHVALLIQRGRVDLQRGRLVEARAALERAVAQAHTLRIDMLPNLALVRAELAVGEGGLEEARDIVQQALGALTGTDADHMRAMLLPIAARIEADDAERCRRLRLPTQGSISQRAAESALQMTNTMISSGRLPKGILAGLTTGKGEVARALGTPDPAIWQAAAELWRAIGQPFEQAYTHFREAEALLSLKGSRQEIRSLLADALDTAIELGAVPLQAAIDELASRARVELATPLERHRVALPAGLSRRELEVLRLVADGLSNRRIAAMLFISQATVATHVSHILEKLGVSNRVEAGLVARRLGLTSRADPGADLEGAD